jgi:hypothetical protein
VRCSLNPQLRLGKDLSGEGFKLSGVRVYCLADARLQLGCGHAPTLTWRGVSKTSDYRAALRGLDDWETFLLRESGLPGPRANIELVQAAADEGSIDQFRHWLKRDEEFLALCGAVGLGQLSADGSDDLIDDLRAYASDSRWRVREGVALGLQRLGARDMQRLLGVTRSWSGGSWLEKRAAVAALCEPALVRDADAARVVLEIPDAITASMLDVLDRKDEDFRVLRQALAYGWSVAVVGCPSVGKPMLEKWLESDDHDVAWLSRENLKKDRLKRMDPLWVARLSSR